MSQAHTRTAPSALIQSIDARSYGSSDSSTDAFLLASMDDCSRVVLTWEKHQHQQQQETDQAASAQQGLLSEARTEAAGEQQSLMFTASHKGSDVREANLPRCTTRVRLHPYEQGHLACFQQHNNSLHLYDKDRLAAWYRGWVGTKGNRKDKIDGEDGEDGEDEKRRKVTCCSHSRTHPHAHMCTFHRGRLSDEFAPVLEPKRRMLLHTLTLAQTRRQLLLWLKVR